MLLPTTHPIYSGRRQFITIDMPYRRLAQLSYRTFGAVVNSNKNSNLSRRSVDPRITLEE